MKLRGPLPTLLAVSASIAACNGASPSAQPDTASTSAASAASTGTGAAASSGAGTAAPSPAAGAIDKARSLPAGAKFSDLVRVARESAGKPEGAACLLQGGKAGAGSALAAPLDKPAEKLADPPADLDALLTNGLKKKPFSDLGFRILTPAGNSEGGDYLDLVTFTPASRVVFDGMTPILVATDKGIYFGAPNMVSDGRVLTDADREQLHTLLPKAKAWVVTAEGDAPIERVREALSMIAGAEGTIILASPLPKASKPTKRRSRYDSRVEKGQPYACSSRHEPGIEAGPIGEYADKTVFDMGKKFDAAVAACQTSGGGGSIHVRMRIDPTGKLVEACAETDDTADPEARKCVVEAVRRLTLPAPEKAGFVNFGSAAVLAGKKMAALCDP